jgi:hypothetical protein
MSTVKIDYDKLKTIANNAGSAADRMNDFINELTRKVVNKYDDVEGGLTNNLTNSQYYVNQKIDALKKKKKKYEGFQKAVETFSDNAKDIDDGVARKIKASKDDFINHHEYIDTSWWTSIKEWFIDLKNSCPLFNAIGQLIDRIVSGMKTLWEDMKWWYKCGGGKEIIGIILAGIGAIGAVILAICALVPPICGIVAICAAIGAVITAINALYNVYTSCQALKAKKEGDPAWAKIYSDRDTVQDGLRQTNFGDGFWNKMSNWGAFAIDAVQTICDVVAIVDGIKQIHNVYKNIKISAKKGKVSFAKRLKQYVFGEKHYTSKGKNMFQKGFVSWRSVIQGRASTAADKGRIVKNLKKVGKIMTRTSKYAQKFFDFTLDGKGSWKKAGKDFRKGFGKIYKTTDTLNNIYDLYDKNWKSFKKDYKAVRGLNGLTGGKKATT